MKNGDIKEVGDHDTLMALDGKYATFYNSQFVSIYRRNISADLENV